MNFKKIDLNFIVGFTVSVSFSFLLLYCRILKTGSFFYSFLVWNLFLACIPYLITCILQLTKIRATIFWCSFIVWVLFLPNAPYLLTDFKHLKHHLSTVTWYDILLIASFALNGLLIGTKSFLMMINLLDTRVSKTFKHLIIVSVLYLSGFGIYIGRFLRWNSWDIIQNPKELLYDLSAIAMHPVQNIQAYLFTGVFGTFLLLAFYVFQRNNFQLNQSKNL